MTKTKKTKSKPVAPPIDRIQQARAEKTVANVREHYERGRRANREADDFRPRELAERHRISPHTLRKERRFARRYTEDELEEFLSLRRADGMPLHWGHVIYLITLNRKQDRRRLQKRAAREGWSAPQLQAAIQREIRIFAVSAPFPRKNVTVEQIGFSEPIEFIERNPPGQSPSRTSMTQAADRARL